MSSNRKTRRSDEISWKRVLELANELAEKQIKHGEIPVYTQRRSKVKKTGRTIPIYPRVTKDNAKYLSTTTKKYDVSEAEFVDRAMTHFRRHYSATQIKTMLGLASVAKA